MTIFDEIDIQEDPTLDTVQPTTDVFLNISRRLSNQLRVCIPGVVLKYDHTKQSADVQPEFRREYPDGVKKDMPPIYNVPVAMPRSGNTFVHFPLKPGDNVLLLFADRSLENWLDNGGMTNPGDTREHHLADAIAYPGVYPFGKAAAVANNDDVIIKSDTIEMRLKNNNHVQIFNQRYELLNILDDIVTALREAVVYTSTGPQQMRHNMFAVLHARLKTFIDKEDR